VRRRLTRASDRAAWRVWRGRPTVVIRNFTWIRRGSILAKGDVVVRPWALCLGGCVWRRLPDGRERVSFPYRAADDGNVPVISFENKEFERRFLAATRDAFRSAAAKKKPAGMVSRPVVFPSTEASQPSQKGTYDGGF
jgi:hypothetical protein